MIGASLTPVTPLANRRVNLPGAIVSAIPGSRQVELPAALLEFPASSGSGLTKIEGIAV
jgi:hypothetical protein